MSKGHMEAVNALKLLRATDLKTFRDQPAPISLRRPPTIAIVQTPPMLRTKAKIGRPPRKTLLQHGARNLSNLPLEPTYGDARAAAIVADKIWKARMGGERYDTRPASMVPV